MLPACCAVSVGAQKVHGACPNQPALPLCAGLELGVPTWHSILLCMTLSPLGLLSHFITKVGDSSQWGHAAASTQGAPACRHYADRLCCTLAPSFLLWLADGPPLLLCCLQRLWKRAGTAAH